MGNVSIETLLKDIEANRELTSLDLSTWDPRTKPGMESAQNRAKQKIDELENLYRNALDERIIPVFLTGNSTKTKTFAAHASSKGYVVVNGAEHYNVIARNVDRTLAGSKVYDLAQVSEFNTSLREVAGDLNIASFDRVETPPNYIGRGVSNFDDVVTIVSEVVQNTLGTDLSWVYLRTTITNLAIQKRLAKGSFVVFVHSTVPSEVEALKNGLYGGRGFVVDVDNEIETKADYDRLLKEFKQLTVENDSN